MILPIVAYGDPVLKTEAREVEEGEFEEVRELIDNMFETMYNAKGIGLAAPQVNRSLQVFIVDSQQLLEEDDETEENGICETFVNPEILETGGEDWTFEEGCLSIPEIREEVVRPEEVTIRYLDADFEEQETTLTGLTGRIIQHEYDHIEGILFTDHLSGLRKRMLKKELNAIMHGQIDIHYPMEFPLKKKRGAK